MVPNERAQKNHDELFPGHVSTLGCGRLTRSHRQNRKNLKGEMSMSHKTVLVVGSTGSIGHLVVEEAVRQG
jgi:FlaA1/EpsC-like NDP-sugar epimerase